ncbi:MAG: hypothetical protein ACT4N2_02940 [Hyphomicrobium sp.]
MSRLIQAVIGLSTGYLAGAIAGGLAVSMLSTNTHDADVEMAMTAAFVTGPMGAGMGLLAALLWRRPPAGADQSST